MTADRVVESTPTPSSAVTTCAGAGTSRSRAAVTTAERALAADEQLRQVVAGVVLEQAGEPPSTRPSASTASTPMTCARIVPWRRTCAPPAFVATMPPTVAPLRAPWSTPKRQPGRGGVLLQRARASRPRRRSPARRRGRRRRVASSRASERTTSPPRGTPAADEPGVAALGHHRRRRRRGTRPARRATSSRVGRAGRRARPAPPKRPVHVAPVGARRAPDRRGRGPVRRSRRGGARGSSAASTRTLTCV